MKLLDAVHLAVSSLKSRISKTLLTILGLAVGVGAVLTVLELGSAGEIRVEAEIAKLGVDKVWVRPSDSKHTLQAADSALLHDATQAPACAGAYSMTFLQMDGQQWIAQIAGYDESMEHVHQPKLLDGRSFIDEEFQQGSPVCLIDAGLEEALGENTVGKWLTIANRRFRIIGVIKSLSPQAMAAGNGMVIFPLNTFLTTFDDGIAEITLLVPTGQDTEEIACHALEALSTDGYRADTLKDEINAAREIVRIFITVLLCVAMVCMLTGAIGVMNVLLISVKERCHEIGLMKALGSTNNQLGLLFMLEAVAYAAIGGVFGCILSVLMLQLFSVWIGFDASLTLENVLPVMSSTVFLGVFTGVAPALSAARLPPVVALNCE